MVNIHTHRVIILVFAPLHSIPIWILFRAYNNHNNHSEYYSERIIKSVCSHRSVKRPNWSRWKLTWRVWRICPNRLCRISCTCASKRKRCATQTVRNSVSIGIRHDCTERMYALLLQNRPTIECCSSAFSACAVCSVWPPGRCSICVASSRQRNWSSKRVDVIRSGCFRTAGRRRLCFGTEFRPGSIRIK